MNITEVRSFLILAGQLHFGRALCQQHQRSGWFLGFWCKLLKGSISRDTVHPHGALHQHLISRTTPAHYDMYALAD